MRHDADLWSAEYTLAWPAGLVPLPVRTTVIRLRDGRMLVRQVDQPWGEFDRPYPEALLRDKFAALASPDLGARGAGSAWDLCRSAGGAKSARDLTDGLRALAVPRHPA